MRFPPAAGSALRHLTGRLARPALVALLLAGLGACASAPGAQVAAAPKAPRPYVSSKRLGDDAFAQFICIREFKPDAATGPAVFLAGAIHIAEPAYYAELQKHLDAQEVVLFEGVGSKDPAAVAKRKAQHEKGQDTYSLLASKLGLVSQMQGIDYHRAHFMNADLAMEDLYRNMDADAAKPGDAGEEARAAKAGLQTVDAMFKPGNVAVGLGLWAIESSPKIRAQIRLTMARMDKQGGDAGFGERLGQAIIQERNGAALTKLAQVLKEQPQAKSISIFYGAAHMPDMEARLVREFGYHAVKSQWLRCITARPLAEGMSKADLDEALSHAAAE